ncbi:MAG TPA: hypothetical protein VN454_07085 [Candidatus Angelobacter sp.]|nr:hypothetical protein [Candidatus Angelobacter sp.]
MKHEYTVYGLSLRSDVEIPGLREAHLEPSSAPVVLTSQSKPDWARMAAQMPAQLVHSLPAAPECDDPAFLVREIGGGAFYFLSYGDGTEFVVDAKGERVWGNCPLPLTIEDLATYFLGPVMGFVLRRQGITPLHASAVCLGDVAVAISGGAGAGKSTTAAALVLRGAPAICEDIAAIAENRGQFFVQPGYPRVCLWPDAVEKLLGDKEALPNLTPTWDKRYLALDGGRARFAEKKLPLGAVYLLGERAMDERAPRIENISPREALLELVQNTYMNALLTKEQRAAEFELLSRLVNRVPCKRLIPHRDATRLGKLCELMEGEGRAISSERQTALTGRQK